MPAASLNVEQVLTVLAGSPGRIAEATAGLSPAQLHAAPARDEWSVNDVLAHLRSCGEVWGKCIGVILAQDRPTIRAISPRSWIEQTDYRDQRFRPSLRAFVAQRAELLAMLEPLPPKAWSRAATVTGAGKPLRPDRTLVCGAARAPRTGARRANRANGADAAIRRSPGCAQIRQPGRYGP